MRKFLFSSMLVMPVMMVPMPAAQGGPPRTFSYTENARASAHSTTTFDVQAGKTIVVRTFVLEPGSSSSWPTHPGDALVLVKRGRVTTYLNCSERAVWEKGRAYGHHPGQMVVRNESEEPAELFVAFFNMPAKEPAATISEDTRAQLDDCAAHGTFSSTEQARVVAHRTGKLVMEAGKQVVVQTFVFEPGFNSLWHTHPADVLILQMRGTITEYRNCTERETWASGYAYLHTPGHHGHGGAANKNEGKTPAEFIGFAFGVWEGHPTPLTPVDWQPPPAECPTESL